MMAWYGDNGMMGWFGGVYMVLMVAGLIALSILLVRGLWTTERRTGPDTATEVMRRRYAAGEISQQEFEQMRQVLAAPPPTPHGPTLS
jgi:putative membrane protein